MDNFNWDDYLPNDDNDENREDNERDLFGTHRLQQELEKGMFLQDVQNGHPLVLDPSEYNTLFGSLSNKDWELLLQSFLTQYHRLGMDVDTLFDTWGGDWIFEILKYCERTEEYELCSIIKDLWELNKSNIRGIEKLIKSPMRETE